MLSIMAVTQQLARIAAEQLAACRASVAELNKLCSFEYKPPAAYLDLDWAPSGLVRACEVAGVAAGTVAALRRALDGDEEVNPAYHESPDTVWEHPVTGLAPPAVAEIAAAVHQIRPQAVLACLPLDADAAKTAIGMNDLLVHPRGYLQPHLAALRSFYDAAARSRQAVVLWWD
jgi:hypothetical protein